MKNRRRWGSWYVSECLCALLDDDELDGFRVTEKGKCVAMVMVARAGPSAADSGDGSCVGALVSGSYS